MEPRDEDDFTHYFNATGRLRAENERLKEILAAALDEHDQHEGQFAPDYMPKHWTHSARAVLEQKADRQ